MSVQKREEEYLNASLECTIAGPELLALFKVLHCSMAMLKWIRSRSFVLWKILDFAASDSLFSQIFSLNGA
jgi:hypothetical protein